MKRDAASTPPRSRSRKKAADAPPAPEAVAEPAPAPAKGKNVGSLESGVSLAAGVLFLVGALFPRTIRQLFLLGVGGFLVYRGTTSKCEVYAALGIDTARQPLLKQINDKYLAPAAGRS